MIHWLSRRFPQPNLTDVSGAHEADQNNDGKIILRACKHDGSWLLSSTDLTRVCGKRNDDGKGWVEMSSVVN